MGVGQAKQNSRRRRHDGVKGGRTPDAPTISRSFLLIRVALVVAILVAFGVRVDHLGAKSFWFDEGLAVFEARGPLSALIPTMVRDEIHPPLYYALLAAWLRFVGPTEFAVRYLSLLAGVLLVPATFWLGRELFATTRSPTLVNGLLSSPAVVHGKGVGGESGAPLPSPDRAERGRPLAEGEGRRESASHLASSRDGHGEKSERFNTDLSGQIAGLGGATLVAVSPFLVDYSQEARMYALLALLALLSSIAFWRAQNGSGVLAWIPYGVLVAALVYTHYFAVLVVAAHLAYFALTLRQSVRHLKALALALAIAAGLYLPWAPGAAAQLLRLQTTPDFWAGELSLAYYLDRLFAAFVIGKSGLATANVVIVVGVAIVVLAAIVIGLWRGIAGRSRGDLFLALAVLVPLGCLYAITVRQPKFTERYLIMVVPAFYLELVRLMVVLGRARLIDRWAFGRGGVVFGRLIATLGVAGFLVVLVVSIAELRNVYDGETYANEDFRAITAYIAEHEEPGDAIGLLMDSHQGFEVYYRGALPIYSLHAGADPSTAADLINAATQGKDRLWLVLWQPDWGDPAWYVRESLFSAFPQYPVPDRFTGLELIVLDLSPQIRFDGRLTPRAATPVNFENQVKLLGYDLAETTVEAGEKPSIVLYWQAAASLSQDMAVSIRIRDDRQIWWRFDGRPSAFTFPTTRWPAGQTMRGRIPIAIPPGTPPGEYNIEIGMYPQETRRDLNVLDAAGRAVGTSSVIGTIRVAQPATPMVDPANVVPPAATFGAVALSKATVETPQVLRGGEVQLELLWHAIRAVDRELRVRLTARDSAGRETTLAEGPPADGRLPTSEWRENELLRDRYRVVIPSTVATGRVQLQIALLDGSNVLGTTEIGAIEIGGRPLTMERPTDVGTPTDVRVGNLARLIGYQIRPERVQPGGEVQLTLLWEAIDSSSVEHTVFTHLLDGQENVWAGQDNPPLRGTAPTSSWQPGEYLRDEYTLRLKDDAPPGEYAVEVGMYDAATLVRLPIFDGSGAAVGDRALLGRVQVGR